MVTPRSLSESLLPNDWRATLWSLFASDQRGEQVSTRIPSIESFRVLAIFAVILWHSHFLSSLSQFADGIFFVVLHGYLVWWVGGALLLHYGRLFLPAISPDTGKSRGSVPSVYSPALVDPTCLDVRVHRDAT